MGLKAGCYRNRSPRVSEYHYQKTHLNVKNSENRSVARDGFEPSVYGL